MKCAITIMNMTVFPKPVGRTISEFDFTAFVNNNC